MLIYSDIQCNFRYYKKVSAKWCINKLKCLQKSLYNKEIVINKCNYVAARPYTIFFYLFHFYMLFLLAACYAHWTQWIVNICFFIISQLICAFAVVSQLFLCYYNHPSRKRKCKKYFCIYFLLLFSVAFLMHQPNGCMQHSLHNNFSLHEIAF